MELAMYEINDELSNNVFHGMMQYMSALFGSSPSLIEKHKLFELKSVGSADLDYRKSTDMVAAGVSNAQRGKTLKAEKLFFEAYTMSPLNIVALRNLVECCMRLDKFILALQYIEKLMGYISITNKIPVSKHERIFIDKYKLYVYTTRGECLYILKNYSEALWNVEKALEIEPKSAFINNIRAELIDLMQRRG